MPLATPTCAVACKLGPYGSRELEGAISPTPAISTSSGAAAAIWSRFYGMTASGVSLYAKRLDRGKFIWPAASDGAVSILAAQMAYMLEGHRLEESTIDLATTERGLSKEKFALVRVLGSPQRIPTCDFLLRRMDVDRDANFQMTLPS